VVIPHRILQEAWLKSTAIITSDAGERGFTARKNHYVNEETGRKTPEEIARMLNVSGETVLAFAKYDCLHHHRTGPRTFRFDQARVKERIAKRFGAING